jgi:hypothetical protein
MKPRSLPTALPVLAALALALLAGCTIRVGPYVNHFGLFGLPILLGDIWASYHVWAGPRDVGSKVMWTLLIWFFPLGGLILFWLFGDRART